MVAKQEPGLHSHSGHNSPTSASGISAVFGTINTHEDPMSQLQWDQETATIEYMMSLKETRGLVAWIWTEALSRQCRGSLLSVVLD